jgi:hypothetical protein
VSTRQNASRPGNLFDRAAYWLIVAGVYLLVGAPELAIVALMVLSVVRGEFRPHRTKSVLLVALAASLYTYFASTAALCAGGR